jgi:hypothetical protein
MTTENATDTGSPITITQGGTGSTTASAARTALGVVIGTNVEAWSAQLDTLSSYNTNGLFTQTAAGTYTGRTLTGTTAQIIVVNGNGVSGNPTLSISPNVNAVSVLMAQGLISN